MRTTIRLSPDLLRAVKRRAAESGRTLTSLIEDALRVALARSPSGAAPVPLELPVSGSGGLRPGVDLDDSADLLDVMDGAR
jgi:hypothetical protein